MPPLKLHTCSDIDLYSADTEKALALPVVEGGISAGDLFVINRSLERVWKMRL